MDVARLNFSHGAHADHATAYRAGPRGVRPHRPRRRRSWPTCRARRSGWAPSPTVRSPGPPAAQVCITVEDVEGTAERVSTTYKDLADDVRVGDRLLVDDGKLALTVVARRGARRLLPGRRGRRGVQQQGPVAARRRRERAGAVGQGRGGPALRPAPVAWTSSPCRSSGTRTTPSWCATIMRQEDIEVPVIAKLEKPEAVDRLEAIVEAFDGIMVARGDLGVELPLEQVPLVQKRAIQAARERNKPVIVATQMLESMISNSRPTRAEASDVANAVLDGADAVMLSGETSVGEHPIGAVRTMERIIDAVESDHHPRPRGDPAVPVPVGRDRAGGQGRRRGARRQGAGHVHPDRGDRATAGRAAPPAAAAGLHRRRAGAQPAGAVLGRGDVPRALGAAHRRHGARRWTSRCCPSAGSRSATASSSSPAARRTRSAPPT